MLSAMLFSAALLAAPTTEPPALRSPALGLGVHGGRWGSDYGSGFRVEAPLLRLGGVRLLTVTQFSNTAAPGEGYTPTVGAGAEIFFRSPLIEDKYRIRLGGGPRAAIDGRHTWAFGGGGFVGVEVLASERMTLTAEFGGQGGSGALDRAEGFSVMGGATFYLGQT